MGKLDELFASFDEETETSENRAEDYFGKEDGSH